MSEFDQNIMTIVRDIFDAGYKFKVTDDIDLRPFLERIKAVIRTDREGRDKKVQDFINGIATASPEKWEMPRDEFDTEFVLWARNVAKSLSTSKTEE